MLTTIEAMAEAKLFPNQSVADNFINSMEERETTTGILYYLVKSEI